MHIWMWNALYIMQEYYLLRHHNEWWKKLNRKTLYVNPEILNRHCTVLFIYLLVPLSFQFSTLIGMWIIPLLLCLKNQWWRFLFLWLLFSCITSLVVRKAIQKPIEGTTPRFVNIFRNSDSYFVLTSAFSIFKK